MTKTQLLQKALIKVGGSNHELETALGVSTDSRSIQKNEVFVAIKGDLFDGHRFLDEVMAKGALCAVVQKENFEQLKASKSINQNQLIIVEDSIQFLRSLAKEYIKELKPKIIAVGGSNGKTTTKEFIAHLLKSLCPPENVFKTNKSENSILGIALNLLRLEPQHLFAVVEVGIDEPGWMNKHLELLDPDYGIITCIEEEHLEKLKDLKTVAEEELSLLRFLAKKGGSFAANIDSSFIRLEQLPEKNLTYSLELDADIEGRFHSGYFLDCFGQNFKNPLPGKHNAQNLLAALTMVRLLKPDLDLQDVEKMKKSLENFKGEAHRSLYKEHSNSIFVYDDCYNANPNSMENALETFFEITQGIQKFGIIGDMLDLGEKEDSAHRRLINILSVSDFEKIFLFGDRLAKATQHSASKSKKLIVANNIEDLKKLISQNIGSYQAYFIKGSRGMKLERVLELF